MAEVVLDDFRQVVQGNVTVSASGSAGPFTDMGAKEIVLVINVSGTVTGTTPTLTYTLAEVDPGNGTTLIGNSVTGAAITATGTQTISLPMMRGSYVQVSWTVTGTTPVFNGVYVTLLNKVAGTTGIYDNNQNGPVAVKPANTAPAATDPALVVSVSPNSPAVGPADATGSGALGALNAAVQVVTAGLRTAGFQLASGTLIGTIVTEVSFDAGTTWNATYFDGATGKVSSYVFASSNAATAATIVGVGGSGISRVRVSAYTSGTANATVRATTRADPSVLYAGAPNATVQPPTTAQIGGWDGTNLRAANVKAASTAAAAGDQALVVSISPNTPIIVGVSQDNTTGTGALGALNAAVSVALAGTAGAGFQLVAGTLIGTIVPEISYDSGTTWGASFFDDPATGNKVGSIVFASSNTATARTIVTADGASNARVRVSAFTSGTATANLCASSQSEPSVLFTGPPVSLIQPPTAVQVAGWDGTNLRVFNVDTSGNLQVGVSPVIIIPSGTIAEHRFGFSAGAGAPQDMRATAYTEQGSAAQRSVKSSSANDTSAGTGARTMTLYYYDNSLNGPFTEVITLNGTTAVNTVSTTIRFIEKMEVTTAGSGLFNAGTITLFSTTAGGGSAVGTIGFGNRITGVGDNQTFWAHHYVRPSKTFYLAGMSTSMTGVTSGVTYGKFINPLVANAVEIVKTPAMGSRQAFGQYAYKTSITIVGPGRFTLYNNATGGNEVDASFEFQEQ